MKYPYSVKANGKWYRPGEEVPETVENSVETVETAVPVETAEPVEPAKAAEDKAPKKAKKDSGKE